MRMAKVKVNDSIDVKAILGNGGPEHGIYEVNRLLHWCGEKFGQEIDMSDGSFEFDFQIGNGIRRDECSILFNFNGDNCHTVLDFTEDVEVTLSFYHDPSDTGYWITNWTREEYGRFGMEVGGQGAKRDVEEEELVARLTLFLNFVLARIGIRAFKAGWKEVDFLFAD